MGGIIGINSTPAEKRSDSEAPSFIPSKFALRMSKPAMKKFRELSIDAPYSGDKKILVLGTSQYLLPCMNGTHFNTGHHSTETFVPMYHLDKIGFKFDIATPDGAPLAIEEWTFPLAVGYEDKITGVRVKLKEQLESPQKYEDIAEDLESYAAVFLPGGHGPIIDMHTYESLGKLLRSANAQGLTTISICHGPSAFRAAAVGGTFPYQGYKMVVFPDSMDKTSPKIGYLPGYLSEDYWCEAKLRALGCLVQNKNMDDSVVVDRELVTGASQLAAQNLTEAAVEILAGKFDFKAK